MIVQLDFESTLVTFRAERDRWRDKAEATTEPTLKQIYEARAMGIEWSMSWLGFTTAAMEASDETIAQLYEVDEIGASSESVG